MAILTTNRLLQKPATAERSWDVPLNLNSDALDGAIGPLAVTVFEAPLASATLKVIVAGGSYVTSTGTIATYAGTGGGGYTLTASSTNRVYIDEATGNLAHSTTAFPGTNSVRLAEVVTNGTTVTGITDKRIAWQSAGAAGSFIPVSPASDVTMGGAGRLILAAAPTVALGAATKGYVDANIGSVAIGSTLGGSPVAGRLLYVGAAGVLAQAAITSGKIVKSDGSGGYAAANAGSDYLAVDGSAAYLTGIPGNQIAGTISAGNLPATTVSPGSYTNTNLTVDSAGRITAAANGSGGTGNMGIGNAITGSPVDYDLLFVGSGGVLAQVAIASGSIVKSTGTGFGAAAAGDFPVFTSANPGVVPGSGGGTSNFLRADGTWVTPAGAGTVTSVACTVPTGFSISGSPITGSGTLAISLSTQSANTVWAGPTSGGAAAPAFRALVAADIPVFVASGASHAAGAVPDPGASSGTAKYLREDATWVNPWTSPTFTGTVTEPVPVWPSQTANRTWSSPDGSSGAPSFRALAAGDIPNLDGAKIATGTVAGARLGVMVASGGSHAQGAVPDPGASSGTAKYLREDATWSSIFTGIRITQHESVWKALPSPSGGTITINWNDGDKWFGTLPNTSVTFAYTNTNAGTSAGGSDLVFRAILLRIKQPASGSTCVVTWPSGSKYPSGSAPALTATNGAVDMVSVSVGDAASTWDTMLVAGNLS